MESETTDGKDRTEKGSWAVALLAAAGGALAYGLSRLLPLWPSVAEEVLGEGRAALPARALSYLSSLVPFSVGEVLLGVYSVVTLALALQAMNAVRTHERTVRHVLGGGLRRILRHGGFALIAFYGVWGLSYARPNLAERGEWPQWSEPPVAELAELTRAAVLGANEAYLNLHGGSDNGSATALPPDLRSLEAAVQLGSTRALQYLPAGQDKGQGMPPARVKRPWSSGLLARFGMAGVFFPFTAEPHVIRGLPAASAVQSFAHERAHLWGFANEAEASYAGYLANALAPDPLPRYSAALFAANQLLRAFGRVDREGAALLRSAFSPGIQRDIDGINEFWRPYRGVGQVLGSALNDRYLRANRVAGGVQSYGRSSRLLVEFARRNGGLIPVLAGPSD